MGESHRMGSDDDFQIRQVLPVGTQFCCWAHWALFFIVNKCIIVNKIHLYIHPTLFCGSQEGDGHLSPLSNCFSLLFHMFRE